MIKRKNMLVITFRTTTEAIEMETCCKSAGAPGRIIPVPKEITAGCGMAWCAKEEDEAILTRLMKENGIEPEAIQMCMV